MGELWDVNKSGVTPRKRIDRVFIDTVHHHTCWCAIVHNNRESTSIIWLMMHTEKIILLTCLAWLKGAIVIDFADTFELYLIYLLRSSMMLEPGT